jgi:large exoprotein involved in heme utilization and adhesion
MRRPEVDPSNGLVELPVNLTDPSNQISNACTPGSRQFENTFTAIGRGGLPSSPTEPLQENRTLSAWVRLEAKSDARANTTIKPQSFAVSNSAKPSARNQIVEASGWVSDRTGNIQLVAQAPHPTSHSPWHPAGCQN